MPFAQDGLSYLLGLCRPAAVACGVWLLCASAPAHAKRIHVDANTALCLDIAGGAPINGAAVQIAKCSNNPAQQWQVADHTLKVFGNKCLDVPHANTAAGTKLQIWDCNGRANQNFKVSDNTIEWTPARLCVDIPANRATDGVRLQTWHCNDTTGQHFHRGEAQAQPQGPQHGAWKLVWSDEFNGSSLDRAKWNVEVNCDGGGNNEQQCYVDSPGNLSVQGGVLRLNVIKQNHNHKPYTSARINTSGKVHWTYGRFETRIKVPCGQGLWPAAWMLPEPNSYGSWPTSGELDIMEVLGGTPRKLYGTAHFGKPWPHQLQKGGIKTKADGAYCDDFHVYAIEWSASQATWFVDNQAYFTLKPKDGAWSPLNHWPFDKPFYFILNLAMGGDWPGPPDGHIEHASMQVDYVRAYTHP